MAATAVELYRGNNLPSKTIKLRGAAASVTLNKKDAERKLANAKKVVDGIKNGLGIVDVQGVTMMTNITKSDLYLVGCYSLDNALKCAPKMIKKNETIAFEREKTIGSVIMYRGAHLVGAQFSWLLAWADKLEPLVYTEINGSPLCNDAEWKKILAKLPQVGQPGQRDQISVATWEDLTSVASIVDGEPSLLEATLLQNGCASTN